MKKLFFTLTIFIFSIHNLLAQPLECTINISIPSEEIVYSITLKNINNIIVQSINELKSIEVNGIKVKLSTSKYENIFIYRVPLDVNNENKVKITFRHNISRDILKNGIVLLSEMMRTLPYIEETKIPNVKVNIELGNNDYKVFSKGNLYSGEYISFSKSYGDPIVIGYFSLLTSVHNSKTLNSIVPSGIESIGIDILSWMIVGIDNVEKDLFKIPFEKIDVIYYPNAPFSETINNTIVLSKIQQGSLDYFSDIERIEGFLTLLHELIHLPLGENINENFIDIIEGFVQFIAIEEIGKIFGEEVKSRIYRNYMLQLRYLSLNDLEERNLIRYRKYPLIFRYIFFLVGEINYLSLYKYLSSIDRDIDSTIFWDTFRNLTGISGDNYKLLFDSTPILWNLSINIESKTNLLVDSTSPIDVNVDLEVIFEDSTNTTLIRVHPNKTFIQPLLKKPQKVAVNKNFYFPEFFFNDNYIGRDLHPVVKDFVGLLSYAFNTKDLSILKKRKVVPSKNLLSKLENYIINKEKLFGNYEIRFFVEDTYRYNNTIIVELTMMHGGANFKICVLTIDYGKSYYIKDFTIF